MIEQVIEISVGRQGREQKIEAIQGDSGRKLVCFVEDMIIPEGAAARIYGEKPSKLEIYNDCEIMGNRIIVELTTQMLAEIGIVPCQIEITKDGKRVTSFDLFINVTKSRVSKSAIESSNEYTALEHILKNTEEYVEKEVEEYLKENGIVSGGGDIDLSGYATKEEVEELSHEIDGQQAQINKSTGYLVGLEFTEEYVPQNIYEFEFGDIESDGSFNNNDWVKRRKFECVGRKKVFIATIEHSKARPTICCYDSEGVFLLGVYTNDSFAEQELECITPTNTAYIYVCTANQNNFDTVKIYNSEEYYIQKSYKYKYTNIFVGSRYDKYFSDFDNFYHNMKFNQTIYKSNLVSDDYWHKLGYSSAYRIECISENSEFKAILKMLNRHSYKPTYNVGDVINVAFKYKSIGDFALRLRSGANTVSEETLDTYGDFIIPNSSGLVREFKCSFSINTLNDEYGSITPQFFSNGNVLNDYIEFVDFTMLQNEDILDGYNYLNKCEVSEFSDLSIMYLGDSITAGQTYSIFVNNLLKPKSIINVAVGGATLTDKVKNQVYDGNPISGDDSNVAGNQVQKILNNNYDAPDIIIFAFGTNDRVISESDKNFESQFTNEDVFTPLSSVDRTTFGGALRYCMETLHGKYPNAQVFIMTPIQSAERKSGDGMGWYYSKLKPKADLINNIGNRMCIPVIDCFNECRIYGGYENSNANGESLADGLHPNEHGAIKMGKFVANEIRNRYIF